MNPDDITPAERAIADRDADDLARYGPDVVSEHDPWAEPDEQATLDTFWSARPVLSHIHTFARARRVSPWATLGVALVRAAAVVPPFVALPPLVGSYGSLNTFVGLVGHSGAGKDAATSAATDAVDVGHVLTVGAGSGEGIIHQFATRTPPNKKTGDPGGIDQHTTSVILTAPEVETLAALKDRRSSTLLPELRKAWTGSELGFAYVDPAKRITLRSHTYRLGLVVGVQPEKAAPILDDADAGTPQRFLWLPANDPDAPAVPPPLPIPMVWKPPAPWPMADAAGKVVLEVCREAADIIDAARLARLRGEPIDDALDGHALLARLKVAAIFALLDDRHGVDETDWWLAGVIADRSARTRQSIVATLREARKAANAARGRDEGERAVVVEETVFESAVRRVARGISGRLGDEWTVARDIRHRVAGRDRKYVDEALMRLANAGHVEVRPIDQAGVRGYEYRRVLGGAQ